MACQLALHSRRPEDMGRLPPEGWREGVAATGAPAPDLPAPGGETLLLKSGYAAHVAQARALDLTGSDHVHGLLCGTAQLDHRLRLPSSRALCLSGCNIRGAPGFGTISCSTEDLHLLIECQGFYVQVRPPKDAQPMPLPEAWGPVVRCHLREVRSGRHVRFSSTCPCTVDVFASTPASA